MRKIKPCPYCGGKASVNQFVSKIEELPKPIPLFGGWSLIKMRYREIPCSYAVECDDFCDDFCVSDLHAFGYTKQEAIDMWNGSVGNDQT